MKAALLIRASRNTQEMTSQLDALLSYAKSEGYEVPEDYIFAEHYTGMDGFDKKTGNYLDTDYVRPSIESLQKLIESDNELKLVICYELTRLSRNPFTIARLVNWFNTRFVTLYIYDVDWRTRKYVPAQAREVTDDAVIENIFAAANYGVSEWKKIRQRTMRGRDFKARQGLYVGHLSDGYAVEIRGREKHIVIDPERAKVVQHIFDLYTKDSCSTDKIASILNSEGIKTFNALEAIKRVKDESFSQYYKSHYTKQQRRKADVLWTGGNIGQLLKNRWYIGERTYKGETYEIPAIISTEQFDLAQNKLFANKHNTPKRRECVYPLRGLLVCGTCGSSMYGHKIRVTSSYYCSSLETGDKCGQEGIDKKNIDSIVWDVIVRNICNRAYVWGEESTIGKKLVSHIKEFLGINDADLEIIEKTIDDLTTKKEQKELELNEKKRLYASLSIQILDPKQNIYANELKAEQRKVDESVRRYTKELAEFENQIYLFTKQKEYLMLSAKTNVIKVIEERIKDIQEKHDLTSLQQIFNSLLKQVTLYQASDYNKIIEITTISQKQYYVIYNPRRLRGKYILCPKLDWTYQPSSQCFVSDSVIYGHEIQFPNSTSTIISSQQEIECSYPKVISQWENQISVDDLYSFLVKGKDNIVDIKHIEADPTDEEFAKWKADQRAWYVAREAKRSEQRKLGRDIQQEELSKFREGKLTIDELVPKVNVSKSQIWRDIQKGFLPAQKYKGNHTYYISEEDAQEYIQKRQ